VLFLNTDSDVHNSFSSVTTNHKHWDSTVHVLEGKLGYTCGGINGQGPRGYDDGWETRQWSH